MADIITFTIEGDTTVENIVGSPEYITIQPDATDHGQMSGLTDDDHPQYALVVLSPTEPVNPREGTIWVQTNP